MSVGEEREEPVFVTVPLAENRPHGVLGLVPTQKRGVKVVFVREAENCKPVARVWELDFPSGTALVVGRNPLAEAARQQVERKVGEGKEVISIQIEGGPQTSRAQILVQRTGEDGLKVRNIGLNPVGIVEKFVAQQATRWFEKL